MLRKKVKHQRRDLKTGRLEARLTFKASFGATAVKVQPSLLLSRVTGTARSK